jgi:hypothetical protein
MNNYIEKRSLKRKDFKLAGILHYKKPVMTPFKHLNGILDNCFEASMLMKPYSVQVFFPKQNNSRIHKMMTMLKKTSEWISNNKKNSAEKPISIQQSEELTKILEFYMPKQRKDFSPKLDALFK